jgi:hypothetical protein
MRRRPGDVLDEYLAAEAMHGLQAPEAAGGEAAIELF